MCACADWYSSYQIRCEDWWLGIRASVWARCRKRKIIGLRRLSPTFFSDCAYSRSIACCGYLTSNQKVLIYTTHNRQTLCLYSEKKNNWQVIIGQKFRLTPAEFLSLTSIRVRPHEFHSLHERNSLLLSHARFAERGGSTPCASDTSLSSIHPRPGKRADGRRVTSGRMTAKEAADKICEPSEGFNWKDLAL